MNTLRTKSPLAVTVIGALLLSGIGHAQDQYPNQQIKIIVPFPAGGGTDITGRLLGEQLRGARYDFSDLRGNFERLLDDLEDATNTEI